MGGRKYELALPFGGLYGVSFYDRHEIKTPDGYRQSPLDACGFPWRWFVCVRTGACVRAFLVDGAGVRVLGTPVGEGAAAYDIPAGPMLLHDGGGIWAMERADFDLEYVAIDTLLLGHENKSQ